MIKKILSILGIIIISFCLVYSWTNVFKNSIEIPSDNYTETDSLSEPSTLDSLKTHVITIGLNEEIVLGRTIITPWAVLEDSRCPSDVQCIWAGKATAGLQIISPKDEIIDDVSSIELPEGGVTYTNNLKITLEKISPYPISSRKTLDNEYRFTLRIEPSNP